jgi:ABC-type glycerol-3-phosphate transport system permease component
MATVTATTGTAVARPGLRRRRRRLHPRTVLTVVGRHALMIAASIVFFGPFLWMVLTSFKSSVEALSYPPTFLPRHWEPSNYVDIFRAAPFGHYYVNSLIVAGLSTLGQVVTSLAAGYAFARLRFRGRNLLFGILMAALLVPFEIVLTPLISLLSALNWLNTYQGLIVPNIPSILGAFLFRQFFSNFPDEIEDATRIDGAGVWRRLTHIMVPMATPMIGAFTILSFVYNWNNFFFQFVVVSKTQYFTVQLGLSQLQSGGLSGSTGFNVLMAGSTLAIVPVVIVFLIFQRQIISAISIGGLR